MKRFMALVAAASMAMYAPAVVAHGGGHGHGGHGHGGHYHHGGHFTSFGQHHHSGFHFGLGHHHHHHHYGFGYSYPWFGWGYSYPSYSSGYYSYPGYRTYSYGYRPCTGSRVIYYTPSYSSQPLIDRGAQRRREAPPQGVPPPPPQVAPDAETLRAQEAPLRFVTSRNGVDVNSPAPPAPGPAASSPLQTLASSSDASVSDQLGPQLAVPRVRPLISDEEVPWVAK